MAAVPAVALTAYHITFMWPRWSICSSVTVLRWVTRIAIARRYAASPRLDQSGGEVGAGLTLEVGAALGLLPLLLSPERREVERGVGAAQPLRTACVHGVGVEHVVAVAQEHAEAGVLVAVAVAHPPHAVGLELGQG